MCNCEPFTGNLPQECTCIIDFLLFYYQRLLFIVHFLILCVKSGTNKNITWNHEETDYHLLYRLKTGAWKSMNQLSTKTEMQEVEENQLR